MAQFASPGWHTDPSDNRWFRFWDGFGWTDFSAPRPMNWGPGPDVTYDPRRLPAAELTPGGYEPVVYSWLGSGEPLTSEQSRAATQLERWYRLDQRADSWWSTPMLGTFATYLMSMLIVVNVVGNRFTPSGFVSAANIAIGIGLLAQLGIWIVIQVRLPKSRRLAWTAGLSWVVAPKPQRRGQWRHSLLLLPWLAVLIIWLIWLWGTSPGPDDAQFVSVFVPVWLATAVIDAIGRLRNWWVF